MERDHLCNICVGQQYIRQTETSGCVSKSRLHFSRLVLPIMLSTSPVFVEGYYTTAETWSKVRKASGK